MALTDLWYMALPAHELARGKMVHKRLAGHPIVFGRDAATGTVFALRDLCPHRGVPLSKGRMVEGTIECPYHGWRFAADGRCVAIPSLVPEQDFETTRIRARAYPVRERHGLIWIYMGERADPGLATNADAPEPPSLPALPPDAKPRHVESMLFPCDIDHAVIGLMDPAHGPFVHRAWWWRSSKSIHAKQKAFAPSPLGFTMVRHKPSSNSAAYKILRGEVSTEIAFSLPGVRIEHVQMDRAGKPAQHYVGITAVTPVDEHQTMVHHAIYWTWPWLNLVKPVLPYFARTFLGQDRNIVALQAEGLEDQPDLMLINDADVQAKWYYRLKREWQQARAEGRAFKNPVDARVLRWQS
jgi:phenylpropionate dioxygenase-like ring-hydroxylating dioxygenase large terminal subunit